MVLDRKKANQMSLLEMCKTTGDVNFRVKKNASKMLTNFFFPLTFLLKMSHLRLVEKMLKSGLAVRCL